MQGDTLIQITWHARRTPLAPVGLAAQGDVATKLAHRLMQEPVELLTRFKGVSGPGLLIILGSEELLPWVDQVVYLGRDPQAPTLLLPTNLEPSVPLSLLEQSLRVSSGDGAPLAVLLNPPAIILVSEARPVARQLLIKWLEADL